MDASWVTSPCAQRAFQSGDIQPFDPADAAQVAEVDAVFDSVYGRADPKFIASGTVSRDPGMLQRAEWIEFFALFFSAPASLCRRAGLTLAQTWRSAPTTTLRRFRRATSATPPP